MLYNYSDMSKFFNVISKIEPNSGLIYIDEIKGYCSYNYAYNLLGHVLYGGLTMDDYKFIHESINNMMDKACYIGNIFNYYDPIVLKNLYHNFVNLFGDKAPEMIESNSVFGHAYVNAMKRYNKSCKYQDLTSIPDAKTIFEELKKLLNRMERDGFRIDSEFHKYMQ